MAIQLDRVRKRVAANAPEMASTSLDPESVEKLRALGYMASFVHDSHSKGEDPKMHIQVANDLHDANLRIEEGKETTAIPLLERVVAEDPLIPHAQYSWASRIRKFTSTIKRFRISARPSSWFRIP